MTTDTNDFQAKEHRGRAESRVRGLMLGLALGETLGATGGAAGDALPAAGTLRAGVATQLACFTAEGIIRAMVRGAHKGLCHPPSVLWHAYCRWAALQGIDRDRLAARWGTFSGGEWPDGWLAEVPALAARRGTAPATVEALSSREQGTVDKPATTSRGWHALGRTLPIAALIGPRDVRSSIAQDREIAALTHGDPAAGSAAAHATMFLRRCIAGEGVVEALRSGLTALGPGEGPSDGPAAAAEDEQRRLADALDRSAADPADPDVLRRLAPDPTAPSALLGALYVAGSFPGRDQVRAALRFASTAPDGASVACTTGALLGAAHGAEALPLDLVSRHELGWVLDTLARDLVTEQFDSPSGSEYARGWDPHWWGRYPGW
ncbi:ADP-ribosylglycohydrolase family protein [Streptomyces sp. OZ13]|uniref:ADP-ribosylglycohydrolase family protein n=1 Tax=Streptomyces sp. OZ13 TaxID=3452210 RepID=UPI003F8B6761